MTRHIDTDHLLQPEVPLQIRSEKGSNKASTGCIHMNAAIEVLLDQQIVDGLDIFILARVCHAQDDANADCILIHSFDRLFWIDNIAILRAVDIAFLDVQISCSCNLISNEDKRREHVVP